MSPPSPSFELPLDIIDELYQAVDDQRQRALDPDLGRDERVEAAGLYLEALGALAAAGHEPEAGLPAELPAELTRSALAALDAGALRSEADRLARLVEEAVDDPFEDVHLDVLAERVEDALLERQRFDRRLAGARVVLGEAAGWSDEQAGAVGYFDTLLRPLAWGLAFANRGREGHALMVAPEQRPQHWWWFEALDVSWDALGAAAELAELVERYPTFARYFERLRLAARQRLGLGAGAGAAAAEPGPALRLAAATAAERRAPLAVLELGRGSVLFLRSSDRGHHLRLLLDERDALGGTPVFVPQGGAAIAGHEQAPGSWVFDLGPTLPPRGRLECELNGVAVGHDVELG